MAKDKGVLSDHTRAKRKLVPPLLQAMGDKYAPYSWTKQLVPEALWIWLLIDRHGFNAGPKIASAVAKAAADVSGVDPKPLFCKNTSFRMLTTVEKARVLQNLDGTVIEQFNAALAPFFELCPENPLIFLWDKRAAPDHVRDSFPRSLDALYDRYGRPTAITLATITWMAISQDKLHISSHLLDKVEEDFEHIADYPSTERSKTAAASFRAGAPMTLMMGSDGFDQNEGWQQYFWDRVGTIGACVSSYEDPADDYVPKDDLLGEVVFMYRNAAREEMRARLKNWKLDLHNIEVFEVASALLARQTSLALDLALAPSIWNPQTAPLILRAMADVFITMAWIFADDAKARATKFVEDGLGTIKLEIAHRRKALETGEQLDEADAQKYIDLLQSWLDSQRLHHLVEVNLGSWSGMSTRAMAQEAGFLDFYNYVYQPWSSAVHSNWFHISGFNSVMCENPAHRNHRMGKVLEMHIDPHWLYLGAKYLQKAFALFDEKTGVRVSTPISFDLLIELLGRIEPDFDEAGSKEE